MERSDITPELQTKIENEFKDLVQKSKVLSSIQKKVADGKATYADAQDYAGELSNCLQDAYSSALSGDSLPNGTLYFNIANRLIPPYMRDLYDQISDVCHDVQQGLNEKAQIGIRPVQAEMNQDRIDGIVDRISSEPFEDVKWLLKAPLETFARSIVDDHVKANADFHYKAGMKPKIVRKAHSGCCNECLGLDGEYLYSPEMNQKVYWRHGNCKCVVEYNPADGSKMVQDVHTKEWKESNEAQQERIRFADQGSGISNNKPDADVLKGIQKTDLILGKFKDVTDDLKKDPRPGTFEMEEGYKPGKHKEEIGFANWFVKKMGGLLIGQNEREIVWCDYLWGAEFWELKTLTKGTINAISNAIRKGLKQIESAEANNISGTATGIMIDISKTDLSVDMVISEAEHVFFRHKGLPVYIMIIRNENILATVKLEKKS